MNKTTTKTSTYTVNRGPVSSGEAAAALIGGVIGAVLAGVVALALTSGVVMLLLGAAHSYDASVPAFGFAATVFLVAAIATATGAGSRAAAK